MGYLVILGGWYHLKYNHNTWERRTGWKVITQKDEVLPGDPRFPMANPRPEGWMHNDRDFSRRKVFLN